jgi:hypothetical protein
VAKKKYLATRRISDNWLPFLADSAPLALQSTGSTADEEKASSPWQIEITGEYTWSYALSYFINVYLPNTPFVS